MKILAVAAMTRLAIINRYVLIPHLRRRPQAALALKRAALVEIGLGVIAIALVAALGTEDPT